MVCITEVCRRKEECGEMSGFKRSTSGLQSVLDLSTCPSDDH